MAGEPALEQMRSGEVVVSDSRLDGESGSVHVAVLIDAPAKTIWTVISSCEHAFRYVDGLEFCEVLVDEADRALTHHVVDPGIFAPKMDFRFETIRQPFVRMDFALTEGNLKQMEGYWTFSPDESGVVVEHELHIRPSVPAPAWLVRRKLARDLPRMMACIRGLAGGSIPASGVDDDLAACRKDRSEAAQ